MDSGHMLSELGVCLVLPEAALYKSTIAVTCIALLVIAVIIIFIHVSGFLGRGAIYESSE